MALERRRYFMKKKVLILLADGFEEIEAITTVDILRRADLEVTTAGVGKPNVTGAHGLEVKSDSEIGSCKDVPDAIVLPGGMPGVNNLAASKDVNDLIKKAHEGGKIIAAICAAPSYVLAPTGVIDGKEVTCYPGCEDLLKGKAKFVDKKVVVDGNIITSKGPGTASDFALKIVETLMGESAKEEVRNRTLYEK
jgi:4-methyl-5(b-hydroxyethyl)-thiazole monophosphate biosynthesis